eukprot:scaffold220159_cov33-Tisochrysis_lutea.AAC.1
MVMVMDSPGVLKLMASQAATNVRSLQLVKILHAIQYRLFGGLLHLTRQKELVQNHVYLRMVEGFVENFAAIHAADTPTSERLQTRHSSPSHLVEVEHQIKFAHIAKELIEQFDKEMYRFKVNKFIVADVLKRRMPCVQAGGAYR